MLWLQLCQTTLLPFGEQRRIVAKDDELVAYATG